jgi:glycosyltransferase involved in cell wall biosynthesis
MWENMYQAVQLAQGDWIVVLCDDDLLIPGALAEFDRVLSFRGDLSQIQCLAGGVEILLDAKVSPLFRFRRTIVQYPIDEIMNSLEEIMKVDSALRLRNVPKLCGSFFKRSGLSLIGWDSSCGGFADLALYLRIQRDDGLFCCKRVFGRFRVHGGNASRLARLWETYPLDAAGRLLQHYVDETTPLGRSVIASVERGYFSSLWKSPLTLRQRSKFAQSLSSLFAGNPARRYMVSQGWFFHLGWFGYALLRPVLHAVSTLVGRVVAAAMKAQRPSRV